MWLAGQRVGYVRGLAFEPPTRDAGERLRLELSVRSAVQPFITEGASAQVITSGLLGEAVVNILPAEEPGRVLADRSELPESPELDVYEVTSQLRVLYDSVRPVMERWEEIRRRSREGPGTLARLAETDGELATFQERTRLVSRIFGSLRGTAAKMTEVAADEEVQAAIGRIASRLNELATGWKSQRGTASPLVSDTLLASRLDGVLESMDRIAERLSSGRGTLGRMLNDEALKTELARTQEMLRELRAQFGGPPGGRPPSP